MAGSAARVDLIEVLPSLPLQKPGPTSTSDEGRRWSGNRGLAERFEIPTFRRCSNWTSRRPALPCPAQLEDQRNEALAHHLGGLELTALPLGGLVGSKCRSLGDLDDAGDPDPEKRLRHEPSALALVCMAIPPIPYPAIMGFVHQALSEFCRSVHRRAPDSIVCCFVSWSMQA